MRPLSSPLHNLNVVSESVLISPEQLNLQAPLSPAGQETVRQARSAIQNIMDRRDSRLLVIVGPCSIHDEKAAREYARRLKELADEVSDTLLIVMRVYFEKPRTTTGWKGYINDPDLDDSCRLSEGLTRARQLSVWLAELGLPAATEALDPITPQYLADLFAWAAVGARTTESQTHREMASGLSMPVGFKNGTSGDLDIAINALKSSKSSHKFLGVNAEGQVTVIHTRGNPYGHVILRGGNDQPNYDADSIADCEAALENSGMACNIMVDCSHANSSKQPERQPDVARDLVQQIIGGNRSIMGLMLESHLAAGKQPFPAPDQIKNLKYGVSITDGCIDWATTESLLREMADQLRPVLPGRLAN